MLATIIISCIIGICAIAAIIFIVRQKIKNKGKCSGCGGPCYGCRYSCPSRPAENKDEKDKENKN